MNKNKKTIRLAESDLHRIVKESVNIVLNEGRYDEIKKVYYQLINNIEELIDRLYDNGYAGDGCLEGNEFVEKLKSTRRYIVKFFAHPDVGGAARVWDNVGF